MGRYLCGHRTGFLVLTASNSATTFIRPRLKLSLLVSPDALTELTVAFWKHRSEPTTLLEKRGSSIGRKWVYTFNRPKANKSILD